MKRANSPQETKGGKMVLLSWTAAPSVHQMINGMYIEVKKLHQKPRVGSPKDYFSSGLELSGEKRQA
jgi:hypothetical protein